MGKPLVEHKLPRSLIDLPSDLNKGLPTPAGTGFFVSSDGWFATAAHVVMHGEGESAKVRDNVNQAWLMKESRPGQKPGDMCQYVELKHVDSKNDFALIKVDFAKNSNKAWLQGKTQFPYILTLVLRFGGGRARLSTGYPLSMAKSFEMPGATVGIVEHSPRVTSAIVSSTFWKSRMVMSTADTKVSCLTRL